MAHRVLDLLESEPECYASDGCAGEAPCGRPAQDLRRRGLPYTVVQLESVVDFKFRPGAGKSELRRRARGRQGSLRPILRAMLDRGILLPPSQNEVMFLSTAHTIADVDETLKAIAESLPVSP